MKSDYERQAITVTAVPENRTKERAELASGVNTEHPALAAFYEASKHRRSAAGNLG